MPFLRFTHWFFLVGFASYACASDVEYSVVTGDAASNDQVVKILSELLRTREDHSKLLHKLRLRGRVSSGSLPYSPQLSPTPPSDVVPPEWFEFELLVDGVKRRFEQDFEQMRDGNSEVLRTIRMIDGEAIYNFNGNSMDILPMKDVDAVWNGLVSAASFHTRTHDGRRFQPVSATLLTLLDQLQDASSKMTAGIRELHCSRDGDVVVVDHRDGPKQRTDRSGYRYMMWLDTRHGCEPVRLMEQHGSPGRGLYSTRHVSAVYQQLAPGVSVLKEASSYVYSGGSVAIEQKRAGAKQQNVIIDEVDVGDFSYDETAFTASAFPIPKGTLVEDRRTDPVTQFVFGEPPFDDEWLVNLDTGYDSRKKWATRFFLWGNVVAAIAVISVVVRRRLKSRG